MKILRQVSLLADLSISYLVTHNFRIMSRSTITFLFHRWVGSSPFQSLRVSIAYLATRVLLLQLSRWLGVKMSVLYAARTFTFRKCEPLPSLAEHSPLRYASLFGL
jgi:hypothetical protein